MGQFVPEDILYQFRRTLCQSPAERNNSGRRTRPPAAAGGTYPYSSYIFSHRSGQLYRVLFQQFPECFAIYPGQRCLYCGGIPLWNQKSLAGKTAEPLSETQGETPSEKIKFLSFLKTVMPYTVGNSVETQKKFVDHSKMIAAESLHPLPAESKRNQNLQHAVAVDAESGTAAACRFDRRVVKRSSI